MWNDIEYNFKHYGKKNKYSGKESSLQSACYKLCLRIPARPLVFHVPNQRQQSKAMGNIWKAQGVVAGIPDLIIAHSEQGYNGLVAELKVKGGSLQDHQKYVLGWFEREGWKAGVVWSVDGMKDLINEYYGREVFK